MRPIISFFFLVFFIQSLQAQDSLDIYLDKFQAPCKPYEAAYIRNIKVHKGDIYQIKDFYVEDTTLYQTGYVEIKNSNYFDIKEINPAAIKRGRHIKNGEFKRYYKNGNVEFAGTFVDDRKKGPFKYWYENGNFKGDFIHSDVLEIDHEFRVMTFYDSLNNQLVVDGSGTYYETGDGFQTSGAIKDGYKSETWTGSFWSGKSTFSEQYRMGVLTKGTSVDSAGTEYVYSKILKTPEYSKGVEGFYKYLSKNINYPKKARRAGIEGRVYVQFVVNKAGVPEQIEVIKGVSKECDLEAKRVVENAGKFNPGKYRGQLAKVRMVLPVNFKLN